jgi:epsilon-lactone hydrolase
MSSWRSRALNLFLRQTFKRRLENIMGVSAAEIRRSRRRVERTGALSPPICGTIIEPIDADGITGEWVRHPRSDNRRAVLYLHGGAYAVGSAATFREFASRLAAACGAPVLALDYRLAPEHPFPAALEDATAAWDHLLGTGLDPASVALVGDSAGGGLALATTMSLRDKGQALPGALVCFSPWTDLTASGLSVTDNAPRDPFLVAHLLASAAESYTGAADPTNPLISPLFGNFTGLPPLLIHVGTTEVLLSDSTRFAEKAIAAGVDTTLRCWEDAAHIFHLLARIVPEGRKAILESGRFVTSHTTQS